MRLPAPLWPRAIPLKFHWQTRYLDRVAVRRAAEAPQDLLRTVLDTSRDRFPSVRAAVGLSAGRCSEVLLEAASPLTERLVTLVQQETDPAAGECLAIGLLHTLSRSDDVDYGVVRALAQHDNVWSRYAAAQFLDLTCDEPPTGVDAELLAVLAGDEDPRVRAAARLSWET